MDTRDTPAHLDTRKATATFVPSSIDEETRTVDIVWATETPVLRRSWDGTYREVLSLNPSHVRMTRFQSGRAPLLVQHNSWDPAAHVGVIETAKVEHAQGHARVRFLKDDADADKAWNKVRQGVLVSISVGYQIFKIERTEGTDKIPLVKAIDWEPYEASLVSMPADHASHVRSQETRHMDPINSNNAQTPEQARAEERERVTTITTLAQRHGLAELGARLVNDGVKLDAAREAILNALAARSDNDGTSQVPSGAVERVTSGGQRGAMDDFRSAASDALNLRAGISMKGKPHPAAQDLRRTSAVELARMALSRSGTRHGNLSAGEVVKRAMSTSDFPAILADSVSKAIRSGYELAAETHTAWVRTETVVDFRENLRPLLGSAPDLEKVGELAEYTHGSMTEDAASYKVEKFGRIISLSWELLVNDNLGAFLKVKPGMGQAARRGEADAVYAILTSASGAGPTLSDGQPLFSAAHNNVTTAATMNAAGLALARLAMRRQKALGGGQLSLVPRFLIVPPELETDAEILLASATRHTTSTTESDRPEWMGRLTLVVENRLPAANGFYLAASSDQIDTVVMGRLDENEEGPVIEEEREFNRDAWRAKIRHVYGAKALDFRGLVRVPKAP
ncbi:hypothetical protein F0U62_18680 [Cystobacter fuscus]|uniref:prohead protease/major capsid protein fusion protein n=1 Tax=Cystobacter fuscus TaxID=43 RepID=UPI002B2E7283|nr:hypothetical protein F0U62_18680 [Cystobacter fuscus]